MKVEIYKILKTTAGGFHSWCESNVGIIRKPNNKIKIGTKSLETIISKLKWYQKLWNFIKKICPNMKTQS